MRVGVNAQSVDEITRGWTHPQHSPLTVHRDRHRQIDGDRDVLGIWFQEAEGARFWMQVLTELKHHGARDILIACVDGLKGFPEAIEAVFPQTTVQTCIVHLIRHSLKYVPRRQYYRVVKDLKLI